MFCTKCGVELDQRDVYCSQCGVVTGRGARLAPRPRLTRVRYTNKIAGVCGGIAQYLDTDPTLVRVLWLLLLFSLPPAGIIGYLAAWIVIPKEPLALPHASPAYPTPA